MRIIYRVIARTTSSRQNDGRTTFWNSSVLYCGTDPEAARVAYLASRAEDYRGSYGNRARETVFERFESEPDEIESEAAEEIEVGDA